MGEVPSGDGLFPQPLSGRGRGEVLTSAPQLRGLCDLQPDATAETVRFSSQTWRSRAAMPPDSPQKLVFASATFSVTHVSRALTSPLRLSTTDVKCSISPQMHFRLLQLVSFNTYETFKHVYL